MITDRWPRHGKGAPLAILGAPGQPGVPLHRQHRELGQRLRSTDGLDWAKDHHAVSVVDAGGRETARRTQPYTAAGIAELVRFVHGKEVREVGIERPDGQVQPRYFLITSTVTGESEGTVAPAAGSVAVTCQAGGSVTASPCLPGVVRPT